MNCPGHIQIFKHGLKCYRDLPLRMAEFGVVHRYEPSGALHGLMRVRGFTQDDAHVFCTEEQMAAECLRINELILSTYADFGFEEFVVKLSTRPEKRVGSDEAWDHAEEVMTKVLKQIEEQSGGRIKTGINPGEGAFYGPKFEYVLRDAIGRDWQCGTTQVDFNLPGRFGAFYVDSDGEKKTPVMIHRAICGSMERFLGILIENYAGHFPLWLAPVQVVVATITSDADDYARTVQERLDRGGHAGRARSPQREDQLQGPRALARQGPGDPGLRQARGGGGDGQYPPPRPAGPEVAGARRGGSGACRRGGAAGPKRALGREAIDDAAARPARPARRPERRLLGDHFDVAVEAGFDGEVPLEGLAVVAGDGRVVADRQDHRREGADALDDGVALRGDHRPGGVGDRLAAMLIDELQGQQRRLLVDGRLGQLAGLDLDVGADDGVGVAVAADDVIDAGVEADDLVGGRVLDTGARARRSRPRRARRCRT